MANNDLKNANKNKNDEFYTSLEDIEKEMKYYKEHFKGKTVFCNCDDPFESNFFKYFAMNFNYLGLKKLISTCYAGSQIVTEQLSLLDVKGLIINKKNEKTPYKIEITEVEDANGDGAIDLSDVEYLIKNKNNILTTLKGDGDFRSEECIELLKESDIVVTNPPFSLFREYVAQLIRYNKKFLIIGNVNSITYKDFFALLKNNNVWMGASIHSGDREFRVPDSYPLKASGYRIDENGKKYIRVKGVRWWTNLDYKERHESLILYKKYNSVDYPDYVNYKAINIDKTTDIPCDYDGVMGVPITFMDKYNPEQFRIVALGIVGSCEFTSERKMEILDKSGKGTGKFTINAKGTLYKRYNPDVDSSPAFRDVETGELYSSIYARILIEKLEGDNVNGN